MQPAFLFRCYQANYSSIMCSTVTLAYIVDNVVFYIRYSCGTVLELRLVTCIWYFAFSELFSCLAHHWWLHAVHFTSWTLDLAVCHFSTTTSFPERNKAEASKSPTKHHWITYKTRRRRHCRWPRRLWMSVSSLKNGLRTEGKVVATHLSSALARSGISRHN